MGSDRVVRGANILRLLSRSVDRVAGCQRVAIVSDIMFRKQFERCITDDFAIDGDTIAADFTPAIARLTPSCCAIKFIAPCVGILPVKRRSGIDPNLELLSAQYSGLITSLEGKKNPWHTISRIIYLRETMIFTLRPYQQEAVDATLNHFRRHKTPAVIVLPTGAGKSLVIAELARLARGRVLVLAHVKELVAQNHAKYQALGLEADIFAAGLKRKESHGKVVFGSVQSVARNLDAFQGEFSLLIVDECHRIGDDEESQYQQILTHLTKVNPHLRLLGLDCRH